MESEFLECLSDYHYNHYQERKPNRELLEEISYLAHLIEKMSPGGYNPYQMLFKRLLVPE